MAHAACAKLNPMIAPWIIDEIRRREREQRQRYEQPQLEMPAPPPPDYEGSLPEDEQPSDGGSSRGVIIIDIAAQ